MEASPLHDHQSKLTNTSYMLLPFIPKAASNTLISHTHQVIRWCSAYTLTQYVRIPGFFVSLVRTHGIRRLFYYRACSPSSALTPGRWLPSWLTRVVDYARKNPSGFPSFVVIVTRVSSKLHCQDWVYNNQDATPYGLHSQAEAT